MTFPDIDGLKKWANCVTNANIEEPYIQNRINLIVRALSHELAMQIAKNGTAAIEHIEWRDLERVIARIMEGIGFSAQLTPPAKDGGKDVVISIDGRRFLIEIKHWKQNRVGNKQLKDFLRVIAKESANGGLFLSTSGYTDNAFETLTEIDKESVSFQNSKKIIVLAKTYERANRGLYYPQSDLTNLFFAEP